MPEQCDIAGGASDTRSTDGLTGSVNAKCCSGVGQTNSSQFNIVDPMRGLSEVCREMKSTRLLCSVFVLLARIAMCEALQRVGACNAEAKS